jgi:hypothetical protein
MSVGLLAVIAWAVFPPLPARIDASDFVGIIEVRSLAPASRPDGFRQIADAWVLETFKGDDVPARIEINFDTGATCPNVIYKLDETYLVFLARDPDGTYTSVVTSRYKIEAGAIDHWQGRGLVPVDQVKLEIASLLAP